LTWDFDDLDFDVDTDDVLGQGVDESEAGINCAGEASLGDVVRNIL
jgi:hypothetical protein